MSAAPLISTAYWGMSAVAVAAPLAPCEPPLPPVPALPPLPPLPPSQPPSEPPAAKDLSTDKTKKVKKDKVRTGVSILQKMFKSGWNQGIHVILFFFPLIHSLYSRRRVRPKCLLWWRNGRASKKSWMRKRRAAPVTRIETRWTRRTSRTGGSSSSRRTLPLDIQSPPLNGSGKQFNLPCLLPFSVLH